MSESIITVRDQRQLPALRLRMRRIKNPPRLGREAENLQYEEGSLLDHPIRAAKQSDWESEAERLGRLAIEEQLLRGLPHRQIARLGVLENAISTREDFGLG